jgi:hypothetical protein
VIAWPAPIGSGNGKRRPEQLKAGRHYRLNIIVKRSPSGGEFVCANPFFQSTRINVFRPDVSTHSVGRVVGGTRYVLSIGWVLP